MQCQAKTYKDCDEMSEIVTQGDEVRQAALIEAISEGHSDNQAFQIARYETTAGGLSAMRSEAVQTELKTRRDARIRGGLAQKALKTAETLLDDERTPAATRWSVAKWVLEQAGHSDGQDAGKDKPAGEMSTAELEALILKLEKGLRDAGSGPMINVTPGNGA